MASVALPAEVAVAAGRWVIVLFLRLSALAQPATGAAVPVLTGVAGAPVGGANQQPREEIRQRLVLFREATIVLVLFLLLVVLVLVVLEDAAVR